MSQSSSVSGTRVTAALAERLQQLQASLWEDPPCSHGDIRRPLTIPEWNELQTLCQQGLFDVWLAQPPHSPAPCVLKIGICGDLELLIHPSQIPVQDERFREDPLMSMKALCASLQTDNWTAQTGSF